MGGLDEREELRRAFLATAGYGAAVRTRMSGDASTRSYERLALPGGGTRSSQMPSFGRDGILTAPQVQDVVSYVRTISKQDPAGAASRRGAELFANNCAVCHGAGGEGNRTVGAPRLTDRIWLYGGDRASLTNTVVNAHGGVMPAWGGRLDPVTIKMLAVYVHSLGGGEKFVEAPAPAPAAGEVKVNAAH